MWGWGRRCELREAGVHGASGKRAGCKTLRSIHTLQEGPWGLAQVHKSQVTFPEAPAAFWPSRPSRTPP